MDIDADFNIIYGKATPKLADTRNSVAESQFLSQHRLNGMVISVGNLTTGGTGKTPMVLWIAERLLVEGKSTGILTRGYRGGTGRSGSTSDEVRLLQARLGDRVAFGVGADRFARGSELADRGVGSFVLDDGFREFRDCSQRRDGLRSRGRQHDDYLDDDA